MPLPRIVLLLSLLILSAAPPLHAGGCADEAPGCGFSTCGTPASAVPTYLWGELQPVDRGQLPRDRDTTGFNEFLTRYGIDTPQWMGLDIVGDRLIALAAWGLQIWDLTDPSGLPRRTLTVDAYPATPEWSRNPEIKQPLRGIAASGAYAVVAGVGDIGATLWSISGVPYVVYQDSGYSPEQAAIGSWAGREVAIVPDSTQGLRLYDLTAASPLFRCLESSGLCPGVRLPLIQAENARFVAAAGEIAAYSRGSGRGVTVLALADPLRKASALTDRAVYGIALWRHAAQLYLAARTEADLVLFAVEEPSLALRQVSATPLRDSASQRYTYASVSDGVPFLYVGSDNRCTGDAQREWLLDVSDPAHPRDITPPSLGSTGYWGWYYRGNPTGFNGVMPRAGKFHGAFFYRAALSLLDVHKRAAAPTEPRGAVTWTPQHPTVGEPVTFTAVVEGAQNYHWALPGATPGTAEEPTVTVTYHTAGTWPVGLIACHPGTCLPLDHEIKIQPAQPFIEDLAAAPNPARVGHPVLVTARVSGAAPLTFTWTLPRGTATGNPLSWTPTATGPTTLTLRVANSHGTDTASLDIAVVDQPFGDVAPNDPIGDAVELLDDHGVSLGCKPDQFCPAAPSSRADAVQILLQAKRGASYRPQARGLFVDVDPADPQAGYLEAAYQGGLLTPCGAAPLRICPTAALTRRELAVALLRVAKGAAYTPRRARGLFSDVPRNAPATAFIEEVYRRSLLPACGTQPLRFCPARQVPRSALALATVRALY